MIRKNKETDPPAARVAALTERFDQFGWQAFKLSPSRGEFSESRLSKRRDSSLSGEQLESNGYRAGARKGTTTQESPSRDRRTSVMNGRIIGGFAPAGFRGQTLNYLTLGESRSFPRSQSQRAVQFLPDHGTGFEAVAAIRHFDLQPVI